MNTLPRRRSRFTRPVFLWAMTALLAELLVDGLPGLGFNPPRLLNLLPLLPALLFLLAMVRAIQKMDELQKRICLESVFIAFMLTLVLAFTFGGLEHAGIYRPAWDSLGTPMMFFWACAYIFSSWRYR